MKDSVVMSARRFTVPGLGKSDVERLGHKPASRFAGDASETSMSTWIPALHAGMTELPAPALTARNRFWDIFKRSRRARSKKLKYENFAILRDFRALP